MSALPFDPRDRMAVPPEALHHMADHPILLLHPADPARSDLIAALSDQPNTVYYALIDSNTTITATTAGIMTQIDPTQDTGFASAIDAGRALSAVLIERQARRLILDCADYLIDPQIGEWLRGLADWLATGQLIVTGRAIPLSDWQPALDDGRAVIWQPGMMNANTRYAPADRLSVAGFGRGQVWYGGQSADNWDGPLARRLFYFLIDQSPVSRDQVFAIYWADLSIREATNVFHVTKRKVNETIGCEAVIFQDRRYVVNPAVNLAYDVNSFEASIREAQALALAGDESAALAYWSAAVRHYRQPFLSGESMPWIAQRRDHLREQYAEALAHLAQNAQDVHDDDRALIGWLRAIAEQPLREDWTIAAMTLYAERGDRVAVREQYDRLRGQLHEHLSLTPGATVIAAYRTLIGETPPDM